MKKNKMMRLASSLLVAVLLTTSVISGTFAKYVTSDEASDSARVAKWGVVVKADGTLFGKTYLNGTSNPGENNAAENTITVKANSTSLTDKVLAPGTKNDTGISFAISGQPEVDVYVKSDFDMTLKGWELADGDFYCPVKITVTDGDSSSTVDGVNYTIGSTYSTAAEARVAFINAVEELVVNGAVEENEGTPYPTNTNLAGVTDLQKKITWEWPFEVDNDKDTELGNQTARGVENSISVSWEVSVTQID